ncbi:MAG: dienelactone hydrolase [Chloroflexota bacterium]
MKMYARLMMVVILSFVFTACARPNSSDAAGLRTLEVATPGREAPISVSLWYPASEGGSVSTLGGNNVFEGVPVQQDAAIAEGEFPVVLLAHGGLRAAPNLSSWIASYLATRDFIVAVPHPPQLGPDDAQASIAEVWLRPSDLSATLEAIETDSAVNVHMKEDSVGVVGFLLGGTSALTLAGAQIDPESYVNMCDGEAAIGMDCFWFSDNGVDLQEVDITGLENANYNSDIKVAIAIDPELSTVFTPASLSDITIPVSVINLGTTDTIVPGLNASNLEEFIPNVTYETVPDATQYSSFSECTSRGAAILESEGDNEAICTDGGERSRAEIHMELAEMIESKLVQNLSSNE